jgi:hypothetical protein
MGLTNINGWSDVPRKDLVLSAGDNDDVEAFEHMILIPVAPGTRVTGFIPPNTDTTWVMSVSNGGASDLFFPNDDAGSTEGLRTLMSPGETGYTLSVGRTVYFAFTFNADNPEIQGWYPLVDGRTSSASRQIIENFTHNFADTVTVAGVAATATVAGLLTSDAVALNCVGVLSLGISIANVRVSASDTLEVRFAAGDTISMGSLDWRLVILR